MTSLHTLLAGHTLHKFQTPTGKVVCFVRFAVDDGPTYWMSGQTDDVSTELVLGHIAVQRELLKRELTMTEGDAAPEEEASERIPVEDAIPDVDLDMPPLDPDERVDFALVLASVADEDGVTWSYRTTAAPVLEELLGALEILQAELVADAREGWRGRPN